MVIAKKIGLAQKDLYKCNRVGLIIAGFEIPHCHLHVIPSNTMADLSFEHAAPHVEPAQLKEQAEKLTAALKTV
jgi:diadenosine tetraphosphate (Ap4A) HIT family hydrolase